MIFGLHRWLGVNILTAAIALSSGPLFFKRTDVLAYDLVKSRSCEIGWYNDRIARKFSKNPDSIAAEAPVKFQSD